MKIFNQILLVLYIFLFGLKSHSSDCKLGQHQVNITINTGTNYNYNQLVCEGIKNAVLFFEEQGYVNRAYSFNIIIEDEVYTRDRETNRKLHRVFGYYNGEVKPDQIFISSLGTEYMKNRKSFLKYKGDLTSGINIDETLWASVVTHEASHKIINQLWKEKKSNRTLLKNGLPLGSGAHEYIAYTSQISSLPISYQKRIMEMYEGRFYQIDRMSIQALLHYSFPHLYGASCFKAFDSKIMKAIINGEIDNDRILGIM